jgi:hypothetical protein
MGTSIKQITPIITTVLLLFVSATVQGRDYVPPPNGPYQPSVVINNSQVDDSQQHVYKFPPPDMLLDVNKKPSDFDYQPELRGNEPRQQMAPETVKPIRNQQQSPLMNSQTMPPLPNPDAYSAWQLQQGGRSNNAAPGWGYQEGTPNYNQNVWQQQAPGYGYQQQYPYSYGYPNQYNGTNNQFYGMPSPWNVMPKNPFFSDR